MYSSAFRRPVSPYSLWYFPSDRLAHRANLRRYYPRHRHFDHWVNMWFATGRHVRRETRHSRPRGVLRTDFTTALESGC